MHSEPLSPVEGPTAYDLQRSGMFGHTDAHGRTEAHTPKADIFVGSPEAISPPKVHQTKSKSVSSRPKSAAAGRSGQPAVSERPMWGHKRPQSAAATRSGVPRHVSWYCTAFSQNFLMPNPSLDACKHQKL